MGFWYYRRSRSDNPRDTRTSQPAKRGLKRLFDRGRKPSRHDTSHHVYPHNDQSFSSTIEKGSIAAQAGHLNPSSGVGDSKNTPSYFDSQDKRSPNMRSDYSGGPSSYYNTPLHPQDFRAAHEQRDQDGHGTRSRRGDLTRLGASLVVAGLFGVIIFKPTIGPKAVKQIATSTKVNNASKVCRAGGAVLTADFTDFENVLSISPLGGVTAPGEVLPAPYIRINTKNDGSPFERRMTPVRAPAQADIVAIERHILRDEQGQNPKPSWTVHFKPCDGISVVYERIDQLDPSLIEKAGGLAAFHEIGAPEHLARETSIKIAAADIIGEADGFDVALHDDKVIQQDLARPERYRKNHYARAELFNVPASLIAAITPDDSKSQCPLDYLRKEDQVVWADKLGDAWGIRRAKGDNACRTALINLSGTAQGAWYTDASHNGATTKISAIALAPDSIDPDRLILSLHGRLPSFTLDMIGQPSFAQAVRAVVETPSVETLSVEDSSIETVGIQEIDEDQSEATSQPSIVRDFITLKKGSGLINRGFDEIRDDKLYCYEDMRMNFVGPRVNGVMLLQKISGPQSRANNQENNSSSDILKIEARNDFSRCSQVDETVSLTANATVFFR